MEQPDPAVRQPRMWLVRHGETEWARDGRHTSRTDVPLTDLGRRQGRRLAAKLHGTRFGLVLSSPKMRALETCRLAGYGDRVMLDDDLREWDYGEDEGRTTGEIQRDRPGWSIWRDGPLGGETADAVGVRADRVIELARLGGTKRTAGAGPNEDLDRGAQGDVLCFAHGHVLRILAARWLALPAVDGRLLALSTATVSVLGWERETAVIERWNEA